MWCWAILVTKNSSFVSPRSFASLLHCSCSTFLSQSFSNWLIPSSFPAPPPPCCRRLSFSSSLIYPPSLPVARWPGKEASWLWFVFLPCSAAVQSERRLTATAPPCWIWPRFKTSTGVSCCACFVCGNEPEGFSTRGRSDGGAVAKKPVWAMKGDKEGRKTATEKKDMEKNLENAKVICIKGALTAGFTGIAVNTGIRHSPDYPVWTYQTALRLVLSVQPFISRVMLLIFLVSLVHMWQIIHRGVAWFKSPPFFFFSSLSAGNTLLQLLQRTPHPLYSNNKSFHVK